MFRLNVARMPKIKTRAANDQQAAPSVFPKPKFIPTSPGKPKFRLIKGGRAEGSKEAGKEFGRRKKLCGFCEEEERLQEEEDFRKWRAGVAYALGHKNPFPTVPRMISNEDILRETELGFTSPPHNKRFK
ncbi:hypothetical protein GF412_04060 [Candidatus Micrarchaeota archaeon]|nr:hypothetical protein [Candidatus Micrarchaeota archaeon]MBD3418124.1 hypothetical protein [Candidatus Micrarchaeota archaeon]